MDIVIGPEPNKNSQGHFHTSLVTVSMDKTVPSEGDLTIKLEITPVNNKDTTGKSTTGMKDNTGNCESDYKICDYKSV